jgi:hypothetical protein
MSYNLILNNTNVSPFNKNTFTYNFSDGAFQINNTSVLCISDITIPYSWYNISNQLNNNTFNFIDWLGVSHEIVIPNGFYTVADINAYLDTYFLNNGMYLINDQDQAVVYLYLYQNTTYYANQLLLYAVPTSLPAGWTLGDGWIGFPLVATTPILQVLDNNFQNYIGFTAGDYGGGNVDQSFLSNIIPNSTTVNSIVVQCNLVKNDAGSGGTSNILDTFPITATFGANINYTPPFEKFVKLNAGRYSSLSISFLDQNLNTLPMVDTNVTISLLLKL